MEQEKGKKKFNIAFIVVAILLVALITVGVLILAKMNSGETAVNEDTNKNTEFNSSSANASANGTSSVSFATLKADGKNFDEVQKTLIDYFDNNYFEFGIALSQQYPQIFKGAKVKTNAVIIKVLKSTDDEFQVVAVQGGSLAADVWTGESSVYDAGYRE